MPYSFLIKVLGPVVLIGIGIFVYNNNIDSAIKKGYDSRDIEVSTLEKKLSDTESEKIKINNNLITAKQNNTIYVNEINNLNSKLSSQADEAKLELKAQAKAFASAQKSTNDAMKSLAENVKSNDTNFLDILEQLKGVTYEYDDKNNKCIVVGGGRVLRNAAKGKTG